MKSGNNRRRSEDAGQHDDRQTDDQVTEGTIPADQRQTSKTALAMPSGDVPADPDPLGHRPKQIDQISLEKFMQNQRDSAPSIESFECTDALGLDEISPPAPPNRKQWLFYCLFVVMSIAMLATILLVIAASNKKTSLLVAAQARLQESTKGRSKILETWLEARTAASRRLTESELVRLFITDLAMQPPGAPLPRSLRDQRPYFQKLMADFIRQHDIVRASVMGGDGRVLLSGPGPALSPSDLIDRVRGAPAEWDRLISPIRLIEDTSNTPVVDVLIPFPNAQATGKSSSNTTALLVMTLPIGDILAKVLVGDLIGAEAEAIQLLQRRGNQVERLGIGTNGLRTSDITALDGYDPGDQLPFGRRIAFDDVPVYSAGEPIGDLSWTLVHSIEAKAALAPAYRFILTSIGISIMAILILTASFAALWWHRSTRHHEDLGRLYQSFAYRLSQQRRFLAVITTSLDDWLAVSSPDGRLTYVNPAFTAALGSSARAILGRGEADVMPRPRKTSADDDDLAGLVGDDDQIGVVDIGERRHFVSSTVSSLKDPDGKVTGTVTLTRDMTPLVMQRQRRMLVIRQTIDAFIHAIERRDPFLLGHTRRLRIHAIAIGRKLALEMDDLASLALAASLSQIGKIFIPDDVLLKPGRHSRAEAEIMRGHIGHALSILERIDFDLPIIGMLGQMHERLDGSGYPNGLVGNEICLPARILGAADVFCARTAPRSYRDRLSPGKALYHLANNADRYDLKVVAALAETATNEDQLEELSCPEEAFVDAQIWQDDAGQGKSPANLAA